MKLGDAPCQKGFQRSPFLHNLIISYALVLLAFFMSFPAQVTHFSYSTTSCSSGFKSSTVSFVLCVSSTYFCDVIFFVGVDYILGFLFQNHPT